MKPFLTSMLFAVALAALSASPVPAQAGSTTLTFPPTSDCDYLHGDARTRCVDRRAGKEVPLPTESGSDLAPIATMPSSGGVYSPLSTRGQLPGLSESQTLPVDPYRPNLDRPLPYPEGVGNPQAGKIPSSSGRMPR